MASNRNSPQYVLGVETSCDETSCAVVADGREVLSNVVASQSDLHARFGGVVPEIASRAHIETINHVFSRALAEAGIPRERLAAVAVVNEPGLIGSLLIGLMTAKTLAWVWGLPLVGVNHVYAHAYSAALEAEPIEYPAVALICSGGHTALYLCRSPIELELLGGTIDDAAGEAFDKVASILCLGYPGGPAIERVARSGDPKAISFPRSLLGPASLDFSFSGLKTAVLYHINGVPGAIRRPKNAKLASVDHPRGIEHFSEKEVADVAASFQAAVVDVLRVKLRRAAKKAGVRMLVLGGGVTANTAWRDAAAGLADSLGCTLRLPQRCYCVDNAAMVAGLGWHLLRAGRTAGLDLDAHATVRR